MDANLQFILKINDLLSPAMRSAAAIADSTSARMAADMNKVAGAGKVMSMSINDVREKLQRVNEVRFNSRFTSQFSEATREARKLEQQLDLLENKGKKNVGGGMLGGFVKGTLIAGAITKGIGMVQDFAGDIYRTSLKSSSLKTAINSTTGGKGKEAISQTNAIADKYGLNYEASLEGVKTLTGGLKSMNMPLAEQMKIFEGVSTGIAAMKLGAEESKGAMLALGQMASKGTVSAEELRGQLGERIPGAFGIAAKAMNVTEAQLGKMMQKGEIAAKDFLPKFAAEMQKTFGADALAAATGPAAIQERFNNTIFKMKDSIGNGLMPIITPLIQKFTDLAVVVLPYIQTGIEYIVGLFKDINSGSSQWSEYFNVIKSYALKIWETTKSLWSNIWHIVSGVVEWMGKSELMKDIFWAIGKAAEFILSVVRSIGDMIRWIWDNTIKPIIDAIDWCYSKIKGLFSGGKTEIVVTDGTASPKGFTYPVQAKLNYDPTQVFTGPKLINVPMGFNPIIANNTENFKPGISASPLNDKISKSKADNINSGGQRSITINIGKQIEKLEVHTMTMKEGVEEMGSMIREELKRVLYSVNSMEAA
ncbi:MAG: tape measure protein [Chitinophagaceae bacterium]